MRVYVFGGDKERCIHVANKLNEGGGTAIIGEQIEFRELASKIGREFDCAVFVSENPVEATIDANREGKIRAAACYNQRSIDAAVGARTNLFIVDRNSKDLPNLSPLLSSSKLRERAGSRTEKQEPPIRQKEEKPKVRGEKEDEPEEMEGEEEEDEGDEERRPRRKGEGIGGRIKDIFGIED
jgi:hypothetical protein